MGVQLRATYMGEKTVVVSLTCNKRTDTMVKLCEVFESLKLKIITANITAFSGRLVKTVFVEVSPFSLLFTLSLSRYIPHFTIKVIKYNKISDNCYPSGNRVRIFYDMSMFIIFIFK